MEYRVDQYLPKAFKAITKIKIAQKEFISPDGSIPKEYKGYISSLGANIIQAGIKAAITFYEAEESGSKSDRRLVNAAIKYILTDNNAELTTYSDYKLTQLLSNLTNEEKQQKALEILDAATALKLALRTYKMK
jgi:CRISPR-associated protein Cmr5